MVCLPLGNSMTVQVLLEAMASNSSCIALHQAGEVMASWYDRGSVWEEIVRAVCRCEGDKEV